MESVFRRRRKRFKGSPQQHCIMRCPHCLHQETVCIGRLVVMVKRQVNFFRQIFLVCIATCFFFFFETIAGDNKRNDPAESRVFIDPEQAHFRNYEAEV